MLFAVRCKRERKMPLAGQPRRGPVLILAAGLTAWVLGVACPSQAQISKAHQILLNRGLQLQGMTTKDDVFHLENYTNAGFT